MGYTFREEDLGTTVRQGKTGRRRDTRHWGELAELAFIMKSASLGITASKPFGDRRPYDFLIEHGRRLLRVQVKGVFTNQGGPWRFGYSIGTSQNRYAGRTAYTAEDIDFFAAFVGPFDAWYLIPLDAISGRKFIRLYPAAERTPVPDCSNNTAKPGTC